MTSNDRTDETLLTPARFSALTLLSAKALRLYAERELLTPYRVDPDNGYRYYHPDQVSTGWLISLLRSAEVPLAEVAVIVHSTPSVALAELDRCELSIERRAQSSKTVLTRARQHLTKEITMPDVTNQLIPDRAVISVLRYLHAADADTVISGSVATLRAAAEQHGLRATADPFGVFHAPVTTQSNGPLEICLPVDDLAELTGDLRSYRVAGGRAASRTAVGQQTDYPEILALYDELHSWITDGGHTPVGPPRETWHTTPGGPEPLSLTISWPYAG
jgi:DNA-binding transcriptional MerR regulator